MNEKILYNIPKRWFDKSHDEKLNLINSLNDKRRMEFGLCKAGKKPSKQSKEKTIKVKTEKAVKIKTKASLSSSAQSLFNSLPKEFMKGF